MLSIMSLRDRTKREQGFTLIEMIVVIVIIGILAAIAIPLFINQRKSAIDAATTSDIRGAIIQLETWKGNNPTSGVITTGSFFDQAGLVAYAAQPNDTRKKVYANIRLTQGTQLKVTAGANQDYVICAFNAGGSDAGNDASKAIQYDSASGKLVNGATTGC